MKTKIIIDNEIDKIIEINPVLNDSVRDLCYKPYPNHPKGCPNFNQRNTCPPMALYWKHIIDISQPIYAIINKFDFKYHVKSMKEKHPDWTELQLKCCLYWQGKARKQLKNKIKEFSKNFPHYSIFTCPEAMGVDVTATMKLIGIELEWPPINYTYQIAFAAIKKVLNENT